MAINFVLMCFLGQNIFNLVGLRPEFNIASIVGSVVECSPATRAARVRFPDDANIFISQSSTMQVKKYLEAPGIDPGTSYMLSKRSTI